MDLDLAAICCNFNEYLHRNLCFASKVLGSNEAGDQTLHPPLHAGSEEGHSKGYELTLTQVLIVNSTPRIHTQFYGCSKVRFLIASYDIG